MPHIPVQDASADAFWLMESFMAGTAGGGCTVLLLRHAEARRRENSTASNITGCNYFKHH